MRKIKKNKGNATLLESIESIWHEYKKDEMLYKKIKDFLKGKEKDDILSIMHWYESELKTIEVIPWVLTITSFAVGILLGYSSEITTIGIVDGVTQYHIAYHIVMHVFAVVVVVELLILSSTISNIKKMKYLIEVLNDILSCRK